MCDAPKRNKSFSVHDAFNKVQRQQILICESLFGGKHETGSIAENHKNVLKTNFL
jgi:hypothetical protein